MSASLTDETRERLEELVGHRFGDRGLLDRCLVHRSYRNENPEVQVDNERLEFLGDAVLDLVVALLLWRENPQESEGTLTRARSSVVSEASLAACAKKLGLGDYLFLGRGEELTGGRERDSNEPAGPH